MEWAFLKGSASAFGSDDEEEDGKKEKKETAETYVNYGCVTCPNPKCGALMDQSFLAKWRARGTKPFCSVCLKDF